MKNKKSLINFVGYNNHINEYTISSKYSEVSQRTVHQHFVHCPNSIKDVLLVIQVVDVLNPSHSALEVDWELLQVPGHGVVDHSMDTRKGSTGLLHRLGTLSLHDSSLVHIDTRLDDIELHEFPVPFFLISDCVQVRSMKPSYIANTTQPIFEQTMVLSFERCYRQLSRLWPSAFDLTYYSPAAVVSGDDNLLNIQVPHRVLQDSVRIQIRGRNKIPKITVHEYFSGT